MLISDKKKFIFIHVFKTGGKSITEALEPFAYNRDRGILAQTNPPRKVKPRHHISASKLILLIGKEKFNSYFSFAFVRNPWDWMVSVYYSRFKCPLANAEKASLILNEKIRQIGSFSNFVKQVFNDRKFLPASVPEPFDFMYDQKDRVCSSDGKLLVDFIGRFENLEMDFKEVCSRIGISTELPRLNTSDHKPYQQEYNAETQEMVRQLFEPDISYFNYQF